MSWVTTNNKTGKLEGHGIAFEILNTLSAKYEFSYEIILPSRKTLLDQDGSIMNILKTGVSTSASGIPRVLRSESQHGHKNKILI
jgi:hypothetical protein